MEDFGLDEHYRRLHETFVSNHNGTTAHEILLAGAPLNLAVTLFSLVSIVYATSNYGHLSFW